MLFHFVENSLMDLFGLVIVSQMFSCRNRPMRELEILDGDNELKLVEIDAMTGAVVNVGLSDG